LTNVIGKQEVNGEMNKIRVMIVEDEPSTLAVHEEFVNRESDLQVVGTASTKEDAIYVATSLIPDVILMDINLTQKEDQQGIDVAIHLSIAIPETKIIMLSGLLNEDTVRSTMGLGVACNYLLKSKPHSIPEAIRGSFDEKPFLEGSVIDFIIRDYQESLKSTMVKLTPQHLKILELFYRGYSVEQVSDILQLEEQSVRNHQQTISKRCFGWKWMFRRLSTVELAQRAKVMGLF
jgi:NarL family two-component system response regulator LiaR